MCQGYALTNGVRMSAKKLSALLAGATVGLGGCVTTGARPEGTRLERVHRSPQWHGTSFANALPQQDGSMSRVIKEWFFGGSDYSSPEETPPVVQRRAEELATLPASGLRITWFGHSSTLIEIDGKRVLIDPVWGERVSPFS